MATAPSIFVGIDVAKAELVVATRPTTESWVGRAPVRAAL